MLLGRINTKYCGKTFHAPELTTVSRMGDLTWYRDTGWLAGWLLLESHSYSGGHEKPLRSCEKSSALLTEELHTLLTRHPVTQLSENFP